MKPFLKWAGGKYRIVNRILEVLPKANVLVEPFAGSGAVFLNAGHKKFLVSDSNSDLIGLYKDVQRHGPKFINYAASFFTSKNNTEAVFYEFRDEFNSCRPSRRKSALFVYLNRHCFNGLCRYNSKGKFNVPFGRYKSPSFPFKEIGSFYEKGKFATFNVADFRSAMRAAKPGAVVYCDPPYVPLSPTASFSDYTREGFGLVDQEALATEARRLAGKGIPVVISNHDTDLTRRLYAGAKIVSFPVQRFISSDAQNRGSALELLAIYA